MERNMTLTVSRRRALCDRSGIRSGRRVHVLRVGGAPAAHGLARLARGRDLLRCSQVTAARKASQPVGGWRAPNAQYVNAPTRTNSGPIAKSAPPADG